MGESGLDGEGELMMSLVALMSDAASMSAVVA
jgi:hypothetical protein